MIRKVRDFVRYLTARPKTLFLIDSLGAVLTAFFLFAVLRNFNEYFGMPKTVLTYLAAIAGIFWIYSTVCFLFLKENYAPFIWTISSANLLYCVLTMGLTIYYFPMLTFICITYFLVEIALVLGLVYIELQVATAINRNRINLNP